MKKFPVEISVFGSFVHVTIGTAEEIVRECKRQKRFCPDYSNTGAHVWFKEDEDPALYLKKGFGPATLVHESVHCAHQILRNVGIKWSKESEEVFSYLIAYIFQEIYNKY